MATQKIDLWAGDLAIALLSPRYAPHLYRRKTVAAASRQGTVVYIFGKAPDLGELRQGRENWLAMNEIRVQGLLLDRYHTDFPGLLHKLNRTVYAAAPAPTCSVSKSCGAGRTCTGEMRGPLREKIQNAINRALSDHLDTQAALINVGGRRRNRKKKNKKNGTAGSVWATIQLQAAVPPVRSQLDIPPKSRDSPQVTKTKKSKEVKGKLSPPKCRKGLFAMVAMTFFL